MFLAPTCHLSSWVAEYRCICLRNAQEQGSGSSGKPTASTALIICLKKTRHDSKLGSRKSRGKHWILKSYTCRLELEAHLTQRSHFIQQLTIWNTSFLEAGKPFCSRLRGRKNFIIFNQSIKAKADNNQKEKNIIKFWYFRL